MSAKNNYLKIGIFVLAALALLVGGLLAFGARSYFTPKTRFETAVVGDVSGLSVGSAVQLRGFPVGAVTRIAFSWRAYPSSKSRLLVVEFEVDSDSMPWPPAQAKSRLDQAVGRGLRVIVKGQGITGTSLLSLETLEHPPAAPELDYQPHYYYIPSAPGQFTRMLEHLEKSLENLQEVDFGGINQGVTNALDGVRQLLVKFDRLDLEAIATNANALVIEVRNTSLRLQRTLDRMNLDQVSTNANGLLSEVRESNRRLQMFLVRLNSLPMQDAMADVQQTLQGLDEVLLELKRYPAGFFLGEPPVPATATQPPRRIK